MAFSFKSSTQQQQPSQPFNLNLNINPPSNTGGLFGSTGQNQNQAGSSLFGQPAQTQQGSGLFGASNQSQPNNSTQGQQNNSFILPGPPKIQQNGMFVQSSTQQQQQQPQGTSLFGNLGQSMQQQPQNQSTQQAPRLQLGQSQNGQTYESLSNNSVWAEGRGLSVHRTIPQEMELVAEKWAPQVKHSPLRAYLYHTVDEKDVPLYQPTQDDDPNKWEDAVRKRPNPNTVPVLVRGFWELGKRAQRQMEYIQACNIRLHEINTSLDIALEMHNVRVGARMTQCRQKHVLLSQRCLALAAKTQILRSRGYAMDNAEEELKMKLLKLEKTIFDPMLNGREQEIWARMLNIRERAKRLEKEIEQVRPSAANKDEALDDETVKAAQNVLEDYNKQLKYLQKEVTDITKEFTDWEKASNTRTNVTMAP